MIFFFRALQDTAIKSTSSTSSTRPFAAQFSCLECKESFVKYSQLKRHRRKHESTHPFDCLKCTQRFRTKTLMQKHTKSCKKSKSDNEDEDDDVPLSALKKAETDVER